MTNTTPTTAKLQRLLVELAYAQGMFKATLLCRKRIDEGGNLEDTIAEMRTAVRSAEVKLQKEFQRLPLTASLTASDVERLKDSSLTQRDERHKDDKPS